MEEKLSFYEFTQLSKEEQYNLAFTLGEFINASEKGNVRFALYKLLNSYVEAVYDSTENKIITLTSFLKSD
ncbi:hypothetical protein [Epilithonimonas vandammei]|uniref:Uncharacterized protein n=1 Tax=Epilithonimonas vandammei TaxID=2487072 RepID=A0A3G8XZD1_9FLAO|nr:hypothetical protein [Epilithonimonas vandammei]AZI38622.1 hypothetical protein EIB74_00970 [Epilithonimonas vandammei]